MINISIKQTNSPNLEITKKKANSVAKSSRWTNSLKLKHSPKNTYFLPPVNSPKLKMTQDW